MDRNDFFFIFVVIELFPRGLQLRRQLPTRVALVLEDQPEKVALRGVLALAPIHKAVARVHHSHIVKEDDVAAAELEATGNFMPNSVQCIKSTDLLRGERAQRRWSRPKSVAEPRP